MSHHNESCSPNASVRAWLGLASDDESGSDGDSNRRLEVIAQRLHDVVGSELLVHRWLRRRNASLGDKPIRLLRTADGQARLLRHLERFAER